MKKGSIFIIVALLLMFSGASVATAEASEVTIDVIVEGQTSTIWYGEVTFQTSTITDKQGVTHTIDHPTALGALDEAAKAGGFTYMVSSAWSPLSFVEEVANEANVGQDGWQYRVNWDRPMVAAVDYPLNNGDEVFWYYGAWDAQPSEIPELPHAFYGSVTITDIDKPAPVGSRVKARGEGVVTGPGNPTTISALGIYGTSNPFEPRLVVQGEIEDGATITFYINGVLAEQTAKWRSGEITELNLTVPATAPSLVTSAASSITTSRATVNGNLSNFGTALSADVSFEWGTTTTYGRETTPQTMTSFGPFSFSLSGLSDGTTYHFRAKAVGHDPPAYGADRSFTTRTVSVGPGVGAAPPELPSGTTDVSGKVTTAGRFTRSVTATSEDELCTLTIPRNTVGLTEELEPLDEITMVIMDEPPRPPKKAEIIGLAYDFGPDGATFDPPITLEYTYDPDDIPDWVDEEDLVLAMWDEEAGEWVEIPCTLDTATHTITASVSHFTTFAIIARRPVPPPPALTPAAFSVSDLTIQPAEVQPKEAVTITVSVANTGGTEGSYTAVLKINGVKEAEKSVTVAAGESQVVSFSVSKEECWHYSVVVDGLSSSFAVVAPPVPAPPPPVVPPAPEVEPPINWPLFGGIIGGVVVVALLIFFFVIRPRIKEY